jgi:cell shape-determining protein MreD
MGDTRRRRLEERVAREVLLALAMLGIALVQTALLPRPLQIPLNLLLLLTVCQALLVGPSGAARWAFYGGLSLDLCANQPLGSHALALLAALLLADLPLVRLSRDNWLLPLLGTLLGLLAYHGVLLLLLALLVAPVDLRLYAVTALLPDAVCILIPALPCYLLMRWLRSRRNEVPIDVY